MMDSPEELFRKKFENFESQPSDEVWQKLNRNLKWRNFLRFDFKRLNIYYAAFLAAGVALFLGHSSERFDTMRVSLNDTAVVESPTLVHEQEQTAKIILVNKATNFSVIENNDVKSESKVDSFIKEQIVDNLPKETISEVESDIETIVSNEVEEDSNSYYQQVENVVVADVPKTKTSVVIRNSFAQTMQPVSFEADGIDDNSSIVWLFGDGGFSYGENSRHVFKKSGLYNVKLLIRQNGVCDTIEKQINVTDPQYVLQFPNALNASSAGSCGGQYSINRQPITVFFPKGDVDNVENYLLQIYNRQGKEIFRSDDINIGWDGYYLDSQLPKGVYIYKVSYTFSNGETYSQSGNVTLMFR